MALSEQEQIEVFTAWWKEYGTALVVGISIVLASYFGWTAWQTHQQTRAEKASVIFQQILDLRNGKAGDQPGANISDLAAQLTKDYSDTYYGQAVKLLLAEEAVKKGDMESAEKELMALVHEKPNETLLLMARLRLGRVLYAEGKYDVALAQLQEPLPSAYKSIFAELRGDVLVAQGKADTASAAYEDALASLSKDSQEQKRVIEMKLNSVAKEAVTQ